jgi:DNA-binding CsgD family transcriptional regulator
MADTRLTEKQQTVLQLRYDHRLGVGEISRRLRISERAVLSRLHNAQRKLSHGRAGLLQPPAARAQRWFNASQITVKSAAGNPLDLESL